MNYKTMVNLVCFTKGAVGDMWVQFEAADLPFFRVAWRSGPWGLWIGWN